MTNNTGFHFLYLQGTLSVEDMDPELTLKIQNLTNCTLTLVT